ncbi:Protein-S-isoprenylcysteine O-methyltransferase [Pseudozyma hubeiensis]|nr:Protein-S-isoprenylcysteine O-methyltransferase [Pseudozyma hubeiensis]
MDLLPSLCLSLTNLTNSSTSPFNLPTSSFTALYSSLTTRISFSIPCRSDMSSCSPPKSDSVGRCWMICLMLSALSTRSVTSSDIAASISSGDIDSVLPRIVKGIVEEGRTVCRALREMYAMEDDMMESKRSISLSSCVRRSIVRIVVLRKPERRLDDL